MADRSERMNGVQRAILAVAGLLLILIAFVSASDDYADHSWLALVEFFGAIACFVLAASSKRRSATHGRD